MTDYRPKRHLKWFKYRKSLYGTASQKRLVYPSYVFIFSLFGITAVTKIVIYLVLLLNPIFTYDYVTYDSKNVSDYYVLAQLPNPALYLQCHM